MTGAPQVDGVQADDHAVDGVRADDRAVGGVLAGGPRSPILGFSLLLALLFALLLALSLGTIAAGCSSGDPPQAHRGDELLLDETRSVDLDGDGVAEWVLVDSDRRRLLISDGTTVLYRSRERWEILEAFIADTDGNGFLEVVALLQSDRGRHLGLFGWAGDRYRELLVTSSLRPLPLSMKIVTAVSAPAGGSAPPGGNPLPGGRPLPGGDAPTGGGAPDGGGAAARGDGPTGGSLDQGSAAGTAPDLIVLTELARLSPHEPTVTCYRWNGFSFTAVVDTEADTAR